MDAELKALHSPDVHDLATFVPEVCDNFGFLLQAMIGPKGADGEESLDIQVCTPKWLADHHGRSALVLGRHHLVVFEYNYEHMAHFISAFCAECSGRTWQEIATRLGRLGKWEFEDYRPAVESQPK